MKPRHLTYLLAALLCAFYLCAAGSMLCFALFRLSAVSSFFHIGDFLKTGWMYNPAPLILLISGKRPHFLPLIVYFLCAIALVALTGGV